MKQSEKTAIEYALEEKIATIKDKTIITLSDFDEFHDLTCKIIMKIEELRKSRDNWRKKYENLSPLTKLNKQNPQ